MPFKKKSRKFALNMTSHASRWISAPGEVFEFYMIYNKKPLTLQEQVNKLKSRGLLIDDKPLAIRYLSNISYYRLRAYTYPFQDNINPSADHKFLRSDIHFSDIIDLYCFDRRLRSLIFNAIEKKLRLQSELRLYKLIVNLLAVVIGLMTKVYIKRKMLLTKMGIKQLHLIY